MSFLNRNKLFQFLVSILWLSLCGYAVSNNLCIIYTEEHTHTPPAIAINLAILNFRDRVLIEKGITEAKY